MFRSKEEIDIFKKALKKEREKKNDNPLKRQLEKHFENSRKRTKKSDSVYSELADELEKDAESSVEGRFYIPNFVYRAKIHPKPKKSGTLSTYLTEDEIEDVAKKCAGLDVNMLHKYYHKNTKMIPSGRIVRTFLNEDNELFGDVVVLDNARGRAMSFFMGEPHPKTGYVLPESLWFKDVSITLAQKLDVQPNKNGKGIKLLPTSKVPLEVSVCFKGDKEGTHILQRIPFKEWVKEMREIKATKGTPDILGCTQLSDLPLIKSEIEKNTPAGETPPEISPESITVDNVYNPATENFSINSNIKESPPPGSITQNNEDVSSTKNTYINKEHLHQFTKLLSKKTILSNTKPGSTNFTSESIEPKKVEL